MSSDESLPSPSSSEEEDEKVSGTRWSEATLRGRGVVCAEEGLGDRLGVEVEEEEGRRLSRSLGVGEEGRAVGEAAPSRQHASPPDRDIPEPRNRTNRSRQVVMTLTRPVAMEKEDPPLRPFTPAAAEDGPALLAGISFPLLLSCFQLICGIQR